MSDDNEMQMMDGENMEEGKRKSMSDEEIMAELKSILSQLRDDELKQVMSMCADMIESKQSSETEPTEPEGPTMDDFKEYAGE